MLTTFAYLLTCCILDQSCILMTLSIHQTQNTGHSEYMTLRIHDTQNT
jgi:hypothetical protein